MGLGLAAGNYFSLPVATVVNPTPFIPWWRWPAIYLCLVLAFAGLFLLLAPSARRAIVWLWRRRKDGPPAVAPGEFAAAAAPSLPVSLPDPVPNYLTSASVAPLPGGGAGDFGNSPESISEIPHLVRPVKHR